MRRKGNQLLVRFRPNSSELYDKEVKKVIEVSCWISIMGIISYNSRSFFSLNL